MLRRLYLGAFCLWMAACTHSLHQVHVSDFDPYSTNEGQLVQAYAEQFVILGLKFDTSYVEDAYTQLQANCRGGNIVGITTQYSTSHGFMSWTNKLLVKGRCLR